VTARSRLGVVVTAGALVAASASGETPTFSAGVATVRVDVLVTDGQGPVPGLEADDFEVLDNGVAQKVDLAQFERLPVSVVLALDTSGSVTGARLEALRASSQAIVGDLKGRDRAGLLAFGNILSLRTGLTDDVDLVRAALDDARAGGDTALVDATYAAMVAGEAKDSRALVIVLSDGADTASFLRPESVLEAARRSNVVVYGVSVAPPAGTGFVDEICDATGGRVLRAASVERIRETFLRILTEFRQRYLLSYVPQGVREDGWHKLVVRVRRRHMTVTSRPGYMGER
jgi:Ca-activated chloride channel family protein